MNNEKSSSLAILIDADNASPKTIGKVLEEIAKYGTAAVKRVYGDWSSVKLQLWKDASLEYSLQPIQQFAYTKGKNATDSAMIIDAMDLLYTERFDGFCLVTSDSDFTKLASRIREESVFVYGVGEQKTPKPFTVACDKFIYTEILTGGQPADNIPMEVVISVLEKAVEAASGEDGWANLASVGSIINKQISEFDPRNYGHPKLGKLVEAAKIFDIKKSDQGVMYIKVKEKK